MSRFVDILNRIRERASLSWLTSSQRASYELLRERMKFLDEVNLCGRHGVGKTFIAWLLNKQGLVAYVPRLEQVGQTQAGVSGWIVVDNLGWRREEVRKALHACRMQGYEKVVLLTTDPVQDQIAAVELQLTSEDMAHVGNNLRGIGVEPYGVSPRSLWDLVIPVDLAFGGGI